jgi:hypothetical protein
MHPEHGGAVSGGKCRRGQRPLQALGQFDT